jgi:cobalamin-dependent methionine synthase I
MFRKLILLLSLLLLLVTASACKATPPVSTKDVDSQLVCEDAVTFLSSVKMLQEESQFENKTALQAQFDVVRKDFTNLREGVAELNTAEVQGFNKAANDLLNAADALPEDVTVSDALKQLKDPIDQVIKATENMETGLKCIVQPQGQDT